MVPGTPNTRPLRDPSRCHWQTENNSTARLGIGPLVDRAVDCSNTKRSRVPIEGHMPTATQLVARQASESDLANSLAVAWGPDSW